MLTPFVYAAPITEVYFKSNYVFESPGGYNYPAIYSGNDIELFKIYVQDYTNDGIVDRFEVDGQAHNPVDNSLDSWSFNFSTRKLNQNIIPGTYTDVDPYPFEVDGKAGFSANITGVGLDTGAPVYNYYGQFKILDFTYDYLELDFWVPV